MTSDQLATTCGAAELDTFESELPSDIEADLVAEFAELLSPIFVFIAKGRLSGTMDVRSWVVLYETRLDLIQSESIDQFAKRKGVSAPRVYALIKEFREAVPGYRSGNRKSATTRTRMSAARRARNGE